MEARGREFFPRGRHSLLFLSFRLSRNDSCPGGHGSLFSPFSQDPGQVFSETMTILRQGVFNYFSVSLSPSWTELINQPGLYLNKESEDQILPSLMAQKSP